MFVCNPNEFEFVVTLVINMIFFCVRNSPVGGKSLWDNLCWDGFGYCYVPILSIA